MILFFRLDTGLLNDFDDTFLCSRKAVAMQSMLMSFQSCSDWLNRDFLPFYIVFSTSKIDYFDSFFEIEWKVIRLFLESIVPVYQRETFQTLKRDEQ